MELDDDAPVQISFRVAPRLRRELAEAARGRRLSTTAFVTEVLEAAVRVEQDPFAALAADMTARFRERLGRDVESGAYAEAAADVDRVEGWQR
jgi:hypothetical protein